MLRSFKQFLGDKLGATDGAIGHVKDFYFDEKNWTVRYLVADTGSWIPGRLVLISPYALGGLEPGEKVLRVNLTRGQIENSPSIEAHKPVSRQYEEEYYRYYGWPYYWQGDALWGMSGFPVFSEKPAPFAGEPAAESRAQREEADAGLWSAQTVIGFHIQTGDETIGRVIDYMVDDRSWVVGYLVVYTGHRLAGNRVLISPDQIDRISLNESKVFVSAAPGTILQTPAGDGPTCAIDAADSRSRSITPPSGRKANDPP
jgi:hypothetical protein